MTLNSRTRRLAAGLCALALTPTRGVAQGDGWHSGILGGLHQRPPEDARVLLRGGRWEAGVFVRRALAPGVSLRMEGVIAPRDLRLPVNASDLGGVIAMTQQLALVPVHIQWERAVVGGLQVAAHAGPVLGVPLRCRYEWAADRGRTAGACHRYGAAARWDVAAGVGGLVAVPVQRARIGVGARYTRGMTAAFAGVSQRPRSVSVLALIEYGRGMRPRG